MELLFRYVPGDHEKDAGSEAPVNFKLGLNAPPNIWLEGVNVGTEQSASAAVVNVATNGCDSLN